MPNIILYHYVYSPYARRIQWYLALRGIPYSQCMQPPLMPRPDVSRLGIHYRRIPIVAIGRDVYLDTHLQIPKLEELHPSIPRLEGVGEADQRAMQRLLSNFVIDGGLFGHGLYLLPTELPLLQDPKFYKDRSDFSGQNMTKEELNRRRPEALRAYADAFAFLESTLLADGRDWILKTDKPTTADIEAVWAFHWVAGIPGALPADRFSPTVYPKVYAWIKRFQEAVSAAKKQTEKPRTVTGEEAAQLIVQSPFNEEEGDVDTTDFVAAAQGLKKGDTVTVWPTESGRSHKDVGKLVSLNAKEFVFEVTTEEGSAIRVHAPRRGFGIKKNADGEPRQKL